MGTSGSAMRERVAFLGGGRMGEALASGLIRSGSRSKDDLILTARRRERMAELAERLGTATTLSNPEAVVRVMSNVPVLVDEAMSVISPGRNADDDHLQVAEDLLAAVGRVIRLPEK